MAWSYRLEAYELLIRGAGEGGVFSYVDHQWLLPGLLLLWIATAAAAITVLVERVDGPAAHELLRRNDDRRAFHIRSEVVPLMVRRLTPNEVQMVRERPYIATRAEFTRRAYDPSSASGESSGASAVSAIADTVATSVPGQQLLRQDSLVYTGARRGRHRRRPTA